MRLRLVKELEWREVAERLVRAEGFVGPLPGEQFLIQGGDLERTREDFIEFLRMGSLGAFDAAVEFGGAGRQEDWAFDLA